MPVLVLIVAASLLIGLLAKTRRIGFWGGFFASLLLTPAGGLLLTLVAGPVNTPTPGKVGSKQH
jgi:hypothetical protein